MNIKVSIQGEIDTNCYLISNSKSCYIIDPVEKSDVIKEEIKKQNLELLGIILTHFHLDHLKAIPDFRNSKIYISKIDYKNLTSPNAVHIMRTEFYSSDYMSNTEEEILNHVIKTANIIKVDDNFVFPFPEKLTTILTPGHTSGSMCVYAPLSNAIFSGDTLFFLSHGRCDLPTGSAREMMHSLKKLSLLPPNTTIYPGHGEMSKIGYELENGVLKRFANGNSR